MTSLLAHFTHYAPAGIAPWLLTFGVFGLWLVRDERGTR